MNEMVWVGLLYLVFLLALAALGLPIAAVLFLLGVAGAVVLLGWPVVLSFGDLAWSNLNDFILVAIPLFVLMGEIMLRSGIADRMYQALAAWLSPIPGGLLHTNIGACALFSATSGSSVATAATIGTVALPSFARHGYNERLVLGSLAAGGTLGILIPPSINLILYGAITNTSIGQLFLAAIIPGLIMTAAFGVLIFAAVALWPQLRGEGNSSVPWRERVSLLLDLVPPVVIFLVVLGSLYSGLATPTEAAAIGVVAVVLMAMFYGRFSIAMLHQAFQSTLRTTAMLLLIIVAAFFLNFVFSLVGLPQAIARWITDLGVSPLATLWVLLLIYIILGCFLETLSMMITTIPITTPLVVALGYDPVWFGVFIVIVCELALITPPVGLNLYVVQGVRGGGKSINDVIVGSLPFVGIMIAVTVLLMYVPDIALWVPRMAIR